MAKSTGAAKAIPQRIAKYQTKEDAARVRERKQTIVDTVVRSLEEAHGGITTEMLLETLTPEDHPLHDRVTWDDSVAGLKYRLKECADMIASVKLVASRIVPGKPQLTVVLPDSPCVRAYVSAFRGEPLLLRTTALSDEARRAVIVERKVGELRSWLKESIDLEELADIREAIQGALSERGF